MKARENPFRTERLESLRYRPQGTTWEALLARLAALRYRAAVVGPRGSGKTTFLEDLARLLAQRGFAVDYRRCNGEPSHGLATIGAVASDGSALRRIVIVDDADILGPLAWLRARWAARDAAGLVAATHREGRLPTLLRTATTPALLAELVRAVAPSEAPRLAPRLGPLHDKHGGNLREALREIYDWYGEARFEPGSRSP